MKSLSLSDAVAPPDEPVVHLLAAGAGGVVTPADPFLDSKSL